ncbi:MAG: hypothetical protein EOM06_12270 [Sphingobacteriia bacterium]|nr:hypothetical protein [Sphingobacteriia bacterium]
MNRRISKLIAFFALVFISFSTMAQEPPPPPDNPSSFGGTNGPVGGGAPVGSGLVILLSLGAAYGGKKIYDLRSQNREI